MKRDGPDDADAFRDASNIFRRTTRQVSGSGWQCGSTRPARPKPPSLWPSHPAPDCARKRARSSEVAYQLRNYVCLYSINRIVSNCLERGFHSVARRLGRVSLAHVDSPTTQSASCVLEL
jgi:hypothetical protein